MTPQEFVPTHHEANRRAAALKAGVEAVIKPHLHRQSCPPFSLDELAIMAWIHCRNHNEISTEKDMYKRLMENFRYYRNLAVEDIYNPTRLTEDLLRTELNYIVRNLSSPRYGHEMPMRTLYRDDATYPSRPGAVCINTLANSRQYLRRVLGSELKHFPQFFVLSPELRLMIYQELLCMDKVLLYLGTGYFQDLECNVDFAMVQDHREQRAGEIPERRRARKAVKHYANTGPPEKTLSLLLANRQIFQEAMPVFYNVNTFRVRGVKRLVQLLGRCGASRRARFSRIEVEEYDDGGRAITKEVFELFAGIKQLQYLRIFTDDEWFLKQSTSHPSNIQWVRLLCKLKVTSLHIESIGGQIASYVRKERSRLDSEVDQVKPKKKASTTSRTGATKTEKASTAI